MVCEMDVVTGDRIEEAGDAELMRCVQRGERSAFEILIRRHQQGLMNFFRRLGAYNEAEDLVQNTFVRLFHYRLKYRETAKFTTFLYTLARHTWIDGFRKRKRRDQLTEAWRQEAEAADHASAQRPRSRLDAEAALARLPEKLRGVVVLGICQGMPYEEVAEILDIPVGTVKSRIFAALQRLKEFFDEDQAVG